MNKFMLYALIALAVWAMISVAILLSGGVQ